jgi:hypothetical protein
MDDEFVGRADAEDETRLETERQVAAEGDHYER